MASSIPTPEQSTGMLSPAATVPKAHRVLACVLCQQRKVKCDRKFPCANCIKAGIQCVPAALLPRQRRRRFPERELLDRLRHYEDLLRKNNIPFEPLHGAAAENYSMADKTSDEHTGTPQASEHNMDVEESPQDSTLNYGAQNFWHAMNRKSQKVCNDESDGDRDADDSDSSSYLLREVQVKNAWDQLYDSNDHLLFCSRNTSIDLATMHPTQAQIFKLWQIYLDNVNPLLKVTHTPTLQSRIIDAAGDIAHINPTLEALMFSIYCVAVFSLSQDQCLSMFGAPREDVLRGYQLGAREALLNCGFLRTSDRDCLTALHFYLISIKPGTDPRSLSSMLGSAVRIAQRMGIDKEAANTKYPVLEAELRRRLWWSLVLFDARLSEMTEMKVGILVPTWDCKVPLNVNDFDLRAEMKTPPTAYNQPSEALFAVVRSELGDFTRHSPFFLDFINPSLKSVARRASTGPTSDVEQLSALEAQFEDKLKSCDPQNPLQFMTIWTCRASLAKSRFVHHLSTCARSAEPQPDAQRLAGMTYALTMLEADTKLMESPLLGGFHWLIYLNFPFPAYVHLLEDLRRRPHGHLADTAWKVMSDNCSARFLDIEKKDNPMERKDNPFFKIFAGVVLQSWATREAASGQSGQQEVPPLIVSRLREKMAHMLEKSQSKNVEQNVVGTAGGDALTPDPMVAFGNFEPLYNMSEQMLNSSPGPFPTPPAQPFMPFNNQWTWPPPNWNSMLSHGW